MEFAIYATLFHSISTDEKPQHFKCPSGKDSWCFFQVSSARGKVPGPHNYHTHLEEEYANYRKPPEMARIVRHNEVPESLEASRIAQSVISRLWQRFQDDGNVSRCYNTGCPRVTTQKNRMRTGIWQLLPKETDGAQYLRPVSSALQFNYRYDSFKT
ncbi:uncharacterized protein TNCV_2017301 [Trichonephila clavipes]|nr:uncharacterized protein TNCV_2017301 [Trichonephila clavipes]